MPSYRVYSLDTAGHIVSGTDLNCPSDDAAISLASEKFATRALYEIWEGARQVRAMGRRPDDSAAMGPPIGPRASPKASGVD
jgi:hypothetical protein